MNEQPRPPGKRPSVLKPDGEGGPEGAIARGVSLLMTVGLYVVLGSVALVAGMMAMFGAGTFWLVVAIAAGIGLLVLTAGLVTQYRTESPRRKRRLPGR
ncbi:hypothetical protein [Longimicrobium sp.]|uniref:hypothetical protein n=1 Tax=Longimicrobium sp. TaxID=2029185 RepID=UPI002CC0C3EA|nr:hypothetical protein [Longimicrobium sp.]HSU12546.1 hypothetical protein [Longimicrobium sp.]